MAGHATYLAERTIHRPPQAARVRQRAVGDGWERGLFRVRRLKRGNSAEYEFAKDAAGRPLELTEEDARAVVTLLNDALREAGDRALTRRSAPARRSG